jgi:hypothetical protein
MKKPKKRKKKYYLILNRSNGYRYGAFPHTPEGLEMAEKYMKKINTTDEELYITER